MNPHPQSVVINAHTAQNRRRAHPAKVIPLSIRVGLAVWVFMIVLTLLIISRCAK